MSYYKIRARRDSASNWSTNNPVLALGEFGFELDTNKLKIGDGVSPWNSLSYIESVAAAHNQDISTINGLQAALDAKAAYSHQHQIADVANLQSALDGKAPTSHSHFISDITNLQTALNNKADLSHSHLIADVTGLQSALDSKSNLGHGHEYYEVNAPGCSGSVLYKGASGWIDADCDFYYKEQTSTLYVNNPSGTSSIVLGPTGLSISSNSSVGSINRINLLSDGETGAGVSLASSGLVTIGDSANESNETKLVVDTPSDKVIIYADNGLLLDGPIVASGTITAPYVTANHFEGGLLGAVQTQVKNTSGGPIAKGVPVYITGTVGATSVLEIAIARADTPAKMPAVGLTETELINNATGHVTILGTLKGLNTNSFTVGNTIYVGPTGGLVNARPTGVNILVQNMGKVGRVNSNNGEIIVTGPGRTNDVPNSLSLDSLYDVETSGVASGQALIYNGSIWSYGSAGSAGGGFTSSGSAPSTGSLAQGYRWFDTENAIEFTLVDDGDSMQWVELPSNGLAASTGTGGGGGGSAGTKTYAVFTPFNNQPPNSSFATADTRNSILVLDFDDSSDESAVFVGVMPEGAVLTSGLKVRIHWMASTATSGTCRWGAQIERMNTDLNSDSFDTAATAGSATNGTSGIITVTEITVTNIDGLQEGEPFRLKVYRDADGTSGTDDMTGDAELVVVEVRSAA